MIKIFQVIHLFYGLKTKCCFFVIFLQKKSLAAWRKKFQVLLLDSLS